MTHQQAEIVTVIASGSVATREYPRVHGPLAPASPAGRVFAGDRRASALDWLPAVRMPTAFGELRMTVFGCPLDVDEHVALIAGDVEGCKDVLVRVHSECLTGDVFGSRRCDCGDQLRLALEKIGNEGRGCLVYIAHEGRGIGLMNKLKAYALQDGGLDTVEANEALGFKADLRDYGLGAQVLQDLGIHKLRLMTNNPKKLAGAEGYGLEVVENVPLRIEPHGIVEPFGWLVNEMG